MAPSEVRAEHSTSPVHGPKSAPASTFCGDTAWGEGGRDPNSPKFLPRGLRGGAGALPGGWSRGWRSSACRGRRRRTAPAPRRGAPARSPAAPRPAPAAPPGPTGTAAAWGGTAWGRAWGRARHSRARSPAARPPAPTCGRSPRSAAPTAATARPWRPRRRGAARPNAATSRCRPGDSPGTPPGPAPHGPARRRRAPGRR